MATRRTRSERDQFLERISNEVGHCERVGKSNPLHIHERLESIRRELQYVQGGLLSAEESDRLLHDLEDVRRKIFDASDNSESSTDNRFRTRRVHKNGKGQPKYDVTPEMLKTLIQCDSTIDDMASSLSLSKSTVSRRLREFGISLKNNYATREEIDAAVILIATAHRLIGPNSIRERLRGQGIHASREMVRESCRRVDPDGVALRSVNRHNIRRRPYHVKHPNSLWHIDGNHKLNRWSIYIHGCVDGFSRFITFMKASDNNRSDTVCQLFQAAEQRCGLPTRIRVDRGTENVLMCNYMSQKRADVESAVLRGKSVHNQRIERLWVDTWNNVIKCYHDMFTLMELERTLDVGSQRHMAVLHFIFLPRLNYDISQFVFQWNHHKLSTEAHKTPSNLFIRGMLGAAVSDSPAVSELFSGGNSTVSSPPQCDGTAAPLSEESVGRLQQHLDPLDVKEDSFFGERLFKRGLALLEDTHEDN